MTKDRIRNVIIQGMVPGCSGDKLYRSLQILELNCWLFELFPQIASGRLRQATFVLLHSIGVAAAFAGPLRGSRRFTDDVVKVRMLCGVQSFDHQIEALLLASRGCKRPDFTHEFELLIWLSRFCM